MLITLLVPTSPRLMGTGLARRVANWESFCARVGDVRTIVVPVAGRADPTDETLTPGPDTDGTLPRLARGLTRAHGRANAHLAEGSNLIVAVRSYLGELALGMNEATGVPVLVDLDDDDASFFEQAGDGDEAARFRRMVVRQRNEAVALTSADGFDGTIRVPNAVHFPDGIDRSHAIAHRVIMVANFTYEPNVDGARWFLSDVAPRVRESIPDFTATLIGPGASRLDPTSPGVVENLVAEYAGASVALAPIFRGSGTRTKIIEAWAHRVPVVSTTLGAAGLDPTHDGDILLGDTAEEFARCVVSLLTDPARAGRLAERAWHHGRERFSLEVVATRAGEILRSAADRRLWLFDANPDVELTEIEDGLVVFDPGLDMVHNLNHTAAAVFMLADGTRDRAAIADEVVTLFGLDSAPLAEISLVIDHLVRTRLLRAVCKSG